MANRNKVELMGRMTSDLQLRDLPSGTKVGSLSLATTRVYKTKDGEKQEETTFVDCEVFGRQAEVLAQYGGKGRELFIDGRLRQDKWEDKTTGDKRQKMIVVIEDFTFLGSPRNQDDQNQQEAPAKAAAPARTAPQSRNTRNARNTQVKEEPTPF
jgi:single-strand DNA-binding protein